MFINSSHNNYRLDILLYKPVKNFIEASLKSNNACTGMHAHNTRVRRAQSQKHRQIPNIFQGPSMVGNIKYV